MSDKPKRRWFQFEIGSLLWLTLVVALAAFAASERWANSALKKEVSYLRARVKVHEEEFRLNEERTKKLGDQLQSLRAAIKSDERTAP